MRIQEAEECKEIDIPISEIVKEGGSLNILPTVKNYFSIDYKPKKNKLSLVAGGFIGLIPINNELAIEIKPKFSISNLTRIVSVAEDKFNTLSFFSKKYHESEDASPVVFEFMVECLANELKALDQEGLLKDYILKQELTHKIRGRIDINMSIKSLWGSGHFNMASIRYFDLTADNPFNRLLKYTLKFCIEELSLYRPKKSILKNTLIEYYTMLNGVSCDVDLACIEEVFDAIENDKISVLRKYYVNICEVCRLIINRSGVNFDRIGGDFNLNSFTLDMASIFEKYLLNSIRINRDVFSGGVSILDGNEEGKKKFYNQPGAGTGDAKPDIVLKDGGGYKIIADAKYKIKSKDSDRYQVISHALSYGAKIAILILPMNDGYAGRALIKLGRVGDEHGIDVYEYYFNLSCDNLVEEEVSLARSLNDFIEGHVI